MKIRTVCAGACALIISAVLAACDSSPSSPSSANNFSSGGGGARFSTIADPGLPQTAVTLKATAPGPISPVDGGVVNDPTVLLEVTSPQSVYNVPWVFEVLFEVYELSNPTTAVYSSLVVQGEGRTVHTLPAGVLQHETVYVWRARAESEGQGGPWSDVLSFTTQFVTIGPPTPLQPTGGVVTASLRPQLFVKNPPTTGSAQDIGLLLVEFEVATDDQFVNVAELGRTTARDRGETGYTLLENLAPYTQFYWRARGTNENLPVTVVLEPGEAIELPSSSGSVFETSSDWSPTATFRTPTAAAATAPPPADSAGAGTFGGTGSSPNAPFTTNGGDATRYLALIQSLARQYPEALANSCQPEGGTWEFMDRAVEALRAIDGRWGYNCKRGDCTDLSLDVVDYYRGSGTSTAQANDSSDVDIFDIIVEHCDPNPKPGFNSVTDQTAEAGTIGRWKYPR